MADTNKKEYTSNLHPKGDMDTTVYPNVKSENIIDKDTTAYNAGKVPDSSLVQKSLDSLSENLETTKIQVDTNKTNIATLQGDVSSLKQDNQTTKTTIAGLVIDNTQNKANIAKNTQDIENLSAVTPTDINVDANGYAILEHDGTEITGQTKKVKFAQTDKSVSFNEVTIPSASALKTKDGTSFGGGGSGSLTGFRKITGTITKKISTDIINSSNGLTNMVQLELANGTYTAGQTIPLNQQFRLNYVKNGNRVLKSKLNSDYVFNPNGVIIKNAYLDTNHSETFKVSMKPSYDEYANDIELADSFEVQANSDVTITSTNRIMYVEMSYFG